MQSSGTLMSELQSYLLDDMLDFYKDLSEDVAKSMTHDAVLEYHKATIEFMIASIDPEKASSISDDQIDSLKFALSSRVKKIILVAMA